MLLGESGDYGVPPSRTPVALQAGLTDHYMRGAFYPEGGGQVIAARLIEVIRAYGGQVRTHVPVARVRIEGGSVAGVVLGGPGGVVDAPVVVSNADLKRTVTELVGEAHFAPGDRRAGPGIPDDAAALRRLPGRRARPGRPWAAQHQLVPLGHATTSRPCTAHSRTGRVPDEDCVYVAVASLKDPGNPRLAPPGYANLQVMTLVPRDYALWHVAPGEVPTGAYHRDPEYRQRKAALAERLVAARSASSPASRTHIDWQETATPVTQERFTHSTGGTSYGIEFAYDQMGPLRIGPETEVAGLYLCGASTPSGHGIGSVLRSGVIAAGAVLGRNLMRAIAAGEVLGDRDRLPPMRDGLGRLARLALIRLPTTVRRIASTRFCVGAPDDQASSVAQRPRHHCASGSLQAARSRMGRPTAIVSTSTISTGPPRSTSGPTCQDQGDEDVTANEGENIHEAPETQSRTKKRRTRMRPSARTRG